MQTPKQSPVVVFQVAMSAILALSLVRGPDAAAVTLAPGDLVVIDQHGALIHVDPQTEQHTVIATAGLCCGHGAQFDLVINANRQIVVITNAMPGQSVAAVVRVNPVDGTQTVVSQGGFLRGPSSVAIDPSGDIFVWDVTLEGFAIIRIDPLTGAQTVVTEYVEG